MLQEGTAHLRRAALSGDWSYILCRQNLLKASKGKQGHNSEILLNVVNVHEFL